MDLLLAFELVEDKWILPTMFVVAWFVQMGLHEGGHAYAATWMGDPIPRMFGRVTLNPFRHIEWKDFGSIMGGVLLPIVTAFSGWIPMGMASVPVSRGTTAHDAKVALAGPLGSFLAAGLGVALTFAVWPIVQTGVLGDLLGTLMIYMGYTLLLTGLVYGVFNLFPVPPLDGGSIAYHFANQSGRDFMDMIRPYGFFILIGVFWFLPSLTGGRISASEFIFRPILEFGSTVTFSLPRSVFGPLTTSGFE